MISAKDKSILRELAKQQAEIAALDVNEDVVRKEIRDSVEISAENIIAMYDEAKKYGLRRRQNDIA
jgi:hypothetical protein